MKTTTFNTNANTNHAPGTEAFLSEARCPCCGAPSWYGGCPWGEVESGPYMMRARAVTCGCGWVGVETDLIHLPPGWMFCGLNADWSVSAYAIDCMIATVGGGFRMGEPNIDNGLPYLIDNEDGSFSIVLRWFNDDDNDRIEEVDTFDTFAEAVCGAMTASTKHKEATEMVRCAFIDAMEAVSRDPDSDDTELAIVFAFDTARDLAGWHQTDNFVAWSKRAPMLDVLNLGLHLALDWHLNRR